MTSQYSFDDGQQGSSKTPRQRGSLLRSFAFGGLTNEQYGDNSIGGLNTRLDAMQKMNGTGAYAPVAPQNSPSAMDLQAQKEGIEDAGNKVKMDALSSQASSINGLGGSGLSQRQKAGALSSLQGAAGAMGMSMDTGIGSMSGLSARQGLAANTAGMVAGNAATDFNTHRELSRATAMNSDARDRAARLGQGPAGGIPSMSGNYLMGSSVTSELAKRGYADGGKPETAEELLARISGKYNLGSQPAAAPAPQAQAAPAPTPKPAGSMIQQAASIFSNRSKQIDKAVNGYAQGGKIKGPGTATSDSIPATTGTGENIRVANGERIVSVEQDKALERIAELLGYDSVDAMFEALTGRPVGPTMKGGQIGAADGASPDWMRVHMPGDRTSVDFNPAPVPAKRTATGAIQDVGAALPAQPSMATDQGSPKIDPEELMQRIARTRGLEYKQPAPSTYVPPAAKPMSQFETVMTQSNQDINSVNSVGAKLHHAAKGVLASIPALAVDAYRGAAPHVAPLFTGQDYKPDTQAAPAPVPGKAPAPQAPAPQAPAPGAAPAGETIQSVQPSGRAAGGVSFGDTQDAFKLSQDIDRRTGTGPGRTLDYQQAGDVPVGSSIDPNNPAYYAAMKGSASKSDLNPYTTMAKRFDAYAKDPALLADRNKVEQLRGSGARIVVGKNGQIEINNSGDFDGSTKGAYTDVNGNPTSVHRGSQQNLEGIADAKNASDMLGRMTRARLESEAAYDPYARASLQAMNAGARNQADIGALNASSRLHGVQADTAEQTAALHKKYLDPKTPVEEKKAIHDYVRAMSGKEEEWKIGTTSSPNPNNPMGPNIQNAFGIKGGQVIKLDDTYNQQQQASKVPPFKDFLAMARKNPANQKFTDAQIEAHYNATYAGKK